MGEGETMKTMTKGNVIIEDIKIGDILYGYEYGCVAVTEVLTLPELKDNVYRWKAKNTKTGKEIEYAQNIKYPHYGLNIYSEPTYAGCRQI